MTTARLIYEDRCPKCRTLARVVLSLHRSVGWGWWGVALPLSAYLLLHIHPLPAAGLVVGVFLFLWAFSAPRYDGLGLKPWVRAGPLLQPFGEVAHGSPGPGRFVVYGSKRVCLDCPGAPVYRVALPLLEHGTHRTLPHNFYLLVGDMLYGGRSALTRLLWHLL